MTEKKLYTCDICKTDYADKEKVKECEMKTKFYYLFQTVRPIERQNHA